MDQPTQKEEVTGPLSTPTEVSCKQCNKKGLIPDFFSYEANDGSELFLCADCREKVSIELNEQSKNASFGMALLLGVLAGAAGGFVWYLVAIFANLEISYLSIGLGYLIGFAVFYGAGKKKNRSLQVMGVLITLVAILFVEYFIFNHFANEYIQQNISQFPDFIPGEYALLVPDGAFWQSFADPFVVFYLAGLYFAFKFLKPPTV